MFKVIVLIIFVLLLQGCHRNCFEDVFNAVNKTGKPAKIIDRGSSPILGTKCEVVYK